MASVLRVFHADSLAGPMRALKRAFEAQHAGIGLELSSGVSKDLARRILEGEACDVFAPSSPAVIEQDLMQQKPAGSGQNAASWYVVFSTNEMVLITARGNPLGLRRVSDLAGAQVKFARVTGANDLACARSMEFLRRAAALEGRPELAQQILERAAADPARPAAIPDVVDAVTAGRAHAGVVYYSAAVAARKDVEILRFPDSVNMSEAIRNAATVPATARDARAAMLFVRFLLSREAQGILKETGQPPLVPALRKGAVPAALD